MHHSRDATQQQSSDLRRALERNKDVHTCNTRIKDILIARPLVFGRHLAPKVFAAVREAFGNAHPEEEVPEKTKIRRLVTRFRDMGSVRLWQLLTERQNT
jgi:hypothetical protein